MKKLIIVPILLFVISACSKSDDNNGEKDLAIRYENILGKWYFKGTIKADGSEIAYIHACPNNRDYVDFLSGGVDKFYDHTYSCSNPNIVNGSYIYLNDGVSIIFDASPTPFPSQKCTIKRITNLQLNIEFTQDLAPGTEKRIMVLTRN